MAYEITVQTDGDGDKYVQIKKDGTVIDRLPFKGYRYRPDLTANPTNFKLIGEDGTVIFTAKYADVSIPAGTDAAKDAAFTDMFMVGGGTGANVNVTNNPLNVSDAQLTATPPYITNTAADILRRSESVLNSIDMGTPAALGQTTMAASTPVVIASDQSTIPVSGTLAITSNFGKDVTAENGSSVTFNAIGTRYAVLGIQLSNDVNLQSVASLNANEKYVLEIVKNPTVAGAFNYVAIPNSGTAVTKQAIGAGTNTVTGGTIIFKTFVNGNSSFFFDLSKLNKLTNAGSDKYVVVITPITVNVGIRVTLNFKENV